MLFFAKYLSLHRDIQPFAEYAVTPCMGVWIETEKVKFLVEPERSHPVWVCGLKLASETLNPIDASHTLYGCVD